MDHHFMWSWPIYWYLFLAGTGAGAIAFSAFIYLRGPGGNFGKHYYTIAKYGALIGPLPVIIGTNFLIFELGRPFRAFNIMTSNFWYKAFNPSPMNYGGWLLILVVPVAVFYALTFFNWKAIIGNKSGKRLDRWSASLRKPLAGAAAPLGIATAIYTAMLLSAMHPVLYGIRLCFGCYLPCRHFLRGLQPSCWSIVSFINLKLMRT